MSDTSLNIGEIKDHFLNHEGGALKTLDHYFGAGIKSSKSWYDHAVILFHAARDATAHELYGRDPERAAATIHRHVRNWTKKALRFKGSPEPWAIPSSLSAFSMLKTMPPSDYVEFCKERALSCLKRCEKKDVITWIHAIADLTMPVDKQFTEALCTRADSLAHKMNGHELHHLAYAMAMLDAVNTARYGKEKPTCVALNFHYIFSRSRVNYELEACPHKAEDNRKMADARFWFDNQSKPYSADPEDKSSLEERVARLFKQAGAKQRKSKVVKDMGHAVDLSFHFNGCNFDVEVDGPTHFIRSTEGQVITLDGSSIYRTLLIARKDPNEKIIRLSHKTYDHYEGNPAMWVGLCRQIREAKPGAYIVDAGGNLNTDLLTRLRTECPVATAAPAANAAGSAPA